MPDFLITADRLRAEARVPSDTPLEPATMLPQLYPADCILLPELGVAALRGWLERHHALVPPGLAVCRDRPLRGGVIAWRGYGLLFADRTDGLDEIRFTFAHEAHHFLHEHLYPRVDLLHRFGDELLPVLDGIRLPTREERLDAILARSSLTFHTHLLEREGAGSPNLIAIEVDADAFACEILAPRAAVQPRMPAFKVYADLLDSLQALLQSEFHLPPAPARTYAQALAADVKEPASLLRRLRLI